MILDRRLILVVAILAASACSSQGAAYPGVSASVAARFASASMAYPYGGAQFTDFIRESYAVNGQRSPEQFYLWLEKAYKASKAVYPGREKQTLEGVLLSRGREISAIPYTAVRAQAIVSTSAWLHKVVKASIPRFSLDRGFEFTKTVKYGERQCFLQSVLLSGMLQKMGVPAGVAMVYRNIQGQESNNGHAVCIVKLPTNQDLIVDASDKEPFVEHRGLFMNAGGYRFMEPHYLPTSPRISGYTLTASRKSVKPSQVAVLDTQFLRSQFFYYRGERAKGGILASAKERTAAGLRQSALFFRRSVALCPQNPLAVYMLGRTLGDLGQRGEADKYLLAASREYQKVGWLPGSPKQYAQAAAARRRPSTKT